MVWNFLGSKKHPAETLLARNGVNVKALREYISPEEEMLLFTYVEEHMAKVPFKVLHAPLILESSLGQVEYPLVVQIQDRIFVFLIWAEPWDAETIREMLVLFGLLKRKKYINASFIVLSPHDIPDILAKFVQDTPAQRFHLINFIDLAVERVGGSMTNLFLANYREAFNERLQQDVESFKRFERTARQHLKPIPGAILNSEPVKASLYLVRRYFEKIFLRETQTIYSPRHKIRFHQKEQESLEFNGSFFFVDFRGKILHDFAREGPLSLIHFIRQVQACLEKPSFLPDKSAFPFFRWLHEFKNLESLEHARHPKELLEIIRFIDQERLTHLAEHRELSALGAYRAFICPRCKEFFQETVTMPKFPALSLEAITEEAHRAMTYEGKFEESQVTCARCQFSFTYDNLAYAVVCRYLPDIQRDIRYRLQRMKDGKLVGGWYAFALTGKGRSLGQEIDDETIYGSFKRYLSQVPLWRNLFIRIVEKKQVEMVTAEDYYHLMVIPPLEPPQEKAQVEKFTKQLFLSSDTYRQFSLKDLAQTPGADETYSYHNWLSEYSHLIADGTYKALVFLDVERFRNCLHETLSSLEISFTVGEDQHYDLTRGAFRTSLDFLHMIPDMIHHAENPREYLYGKIGEINRYFRERENFVTLVGNIVGSDYEIEYSPKEDILYVSKPGDKKPWRLNIGETIAKFGTKGDILDRALRTVLLPEDKSMDICTCGKKAHIALRLKPRQWVKDLMEFEESGLIAQEWHDNYLVYHKQCEDHTEYITEEMLSKWGKTTADLNADYEKSIPLNIFKVQVYTSDIDGYPIMGVVGEDAASMMLEPPWIARIVDLVPYILPQAPRLYAPTTDTLIIALEETPDKILEQFSHRLIVAQHAIFGAREPLDLLAQSELPERGVGRIKISYTSEI